MAQVREAGDRLDAAFAQLGTARTIAEADAALALIDAAAEAGDATAFEKLALVECVGLRRPVDWSKALDRLQAAAELGSIAAAQQLSVLAAASGAEMPAQRPALGYWSKLRNGLDERALLAQRAGQTAVERPFVGVIQRFTSAAECRWLIHRARDRLGPSTVYDHLSGALRPDARRTSEAAVFGFDGTDVVIEAIRARIAATMDLPLPHFEASQVLHYAPGQEFTPHHDYFDPSAAGYREEIALRGQRVATFLIYLNDDFAGGETRFPSLGFNYRGAIGDAIVFASVDPDGQPNPKSLHAGLPPTDGEKWIFSQWIRERAA